MGTRAHRPERARQVDSHMDFDKRWDETLMGQWEETQNDRARSTVSKSTRFPCRSRGPLGSRAQRVASRNPKERIASSGHSAHWVLSVLPALLAYSQGAHRCYHGTTGCSQDTRSLQLRFASERIRPVDRARRRRC